MDQDLQDLGSAAESDGSMQHSAAESAQEELMVEESAHGSCYASEFCCRMPCLASNRQMSDLDVKRFIFST
jgi:hypothetical protein